MSLTHGVENSYRPRLVVVKGTFSPLGGAERDLLNNLNALNEKFTVALLTLIPPSPDDLSQAQVDNIPIFSPKPPWNRPVGRLAEIMARVSHSSTKEWKRLVSTSEVSKVISDAEAIHIVSGPASLEFTTSLSRKIPTHLHMLEPHRGLYEDVLHRTVDGTLNRPMLITSGLLSKQRRQDQRLVRKLILSDGLISGNSPWIIERIMEIYAAEATFLPHSIDTSDWTLNATSEENEAWGHMEQTYNLIEDQYVVTVGRASWVKGTWETISMLESTNFSLVHIGGGDPKDLLQLRLHAEGLGVNFISLPRLSQCEILATFRHSRAMVSHAHHEPMGLTPIESHACGTPVIVVDEGGFRMTTKDKISGRLISRNAPISEWHAALDEAGDSNCRRSWSSAGRSGVADIQMSPIDYACRVYGFLQPLLNTTKPSSNSH